MELRKDFISSRTNIERNSGLTGEKGERERGGRLHKAFLHTNNNIHTYIIQYYSGVVKGLRAQKHFP